MKAEDFYSHIDGCTECHKNDQCYDLCPIGRELLYEVADRCGITAGTLAGINSCSSMLINFLPFIPQRVFPYRFSLFVLLLTCCIPS